MVIRDSEISLFMKRMNGGNSSFLGGILARFLELSTSILEYRKNLYLGLTLPHPYVTLAVVWLCLSWPVLWHGRHRNPSCEFSTWIKFAAAAGNRTPISAMSTHDFQSCISIPQAKSMHYCTHLPIREGLESICSIRFAISLASASCSAFARCSRALLAA